MVHSTNLVTLTWYCQGWKTSQLTLPNKLFLMQVVFKFHNDSHFVAARGHVPLPDARYIGVLTTVALLDDGNLAALRHFRVGAYAPDLVFRHIPNLGSYLGPIDHSMSCCVAF